RPSTRAPGTTSCIRFRQRSSVDFPQPDGPISAVTARGGTESLIPASACFAPYQALPPWRSKTGATVVPSAGTAVSGLGTAAGRGPYGASALGCALADPGTSTAA